MNHSDSYFTTEWDESNGWLSVTCRQCREFEAYSIQSLTRQLPYGVMSFDIVDYLLNMYAIQRYIDNNWSCAHRSCSLNW